MKLELKSFIIGFGVPDMVLRSDDSKEYLQLIDPIVNETPKELGIERTMLQVFDLNDGTKVFMYECIYSYNAESFPKRHIESIVSKWASSIASSMEQYLVTKNIPYSKL